MNKVSYQKLNNLCVVFFFFCEKLRYLDIFFEKKNLYWESCRTLRISKNFNWFGSCAGTLKQSEGAFRINVCSQK